MRAGRAPLGSARGQVEVDLRGEHALHGTVPQVEDALRVRGQDPPPVRVRVPQVPGNEHVHDAADADVEREEVVERQNRQTLERWERS
jgi:hypothetical protein